MTRAQHSDVRLVVRARVKTLVVCTTGLITMSATVTGYVRTDGGSFLDDGFLVGFECTPLGFTSSPKSLIVNVTASTLTVFDARTIQAVGAGRSISVLLPENRVWGHNLETPTPTNRPFITEQYTALPSIWHGQYAGGVKELRALYLLQWWGIPNTADEPLTRPADVITETLFPLGISMPMVTGQHAELISDQLPYYNMVQQDAERERPVCAITIPIRVFT